MQFKPHDRVIIGGRTMLRPGYSLVGKEGVVFAVGGFVPAGHVQVIVDGEVVDDEGGSRALIVNVPMPHLELAAGSRAAAASPSPVAGRTAGALQAVPAGNAKAEGAELGNSESGPAENADKTPAAENKPAATDQPPSGLRLV